MAELLAGLQAAVADRYVLERELGRGGMALVFLARDLKHDRPVALKVLRPDLAAALGVERFLREIQIAARLAHPHILPLHDSGEAKGFIYYVMPYVEGESLRARLNRERQLPLDEALRIAREVADALSYAHSHDVVHRDVKPENILLSGGHALVADFGIARAITAAGKQRVTESGIAVGTPAYMSPEQAGADPQLDGRSDIYSLACVVYEMLGGEPPFTGPSAQAILARKTMDPVPPLRTLRDTVPEPVEQAITTALAKVPADRFSTAWQFAEALAPSPTPPRPVGWLPQRHRRALAVLAAVVAVGFGVIVWRLAIAPPGPLDPQRIVVYPLLPSGGGGKGTELGEEVTLALFAALNSTASLKAVDGWRLLDAQQRSDIRGLPVRAARAIVRGERAGFYSEGRILLADSVRLFLELHDLIADSSVQRTLAFAPTNDAWTIGVRAATSLLTALIPPGQRVDFASLSQRSPAATASYLLGERAYRRARFREAFELYRSAVQADSGFALAALRAAQAASWQNRNAEELIHVALAHAALLTPRYTEFARGLEAYFRAQADSAIRHLRAALRMDPGWPEAWMALGEVYTHLLPRDSPLDSLAEGAFIEVHRLDPGFVPALYHLLEISMRKGDLRSTAALMRQFREAHADSAELVPADLMLRCIGEPARMDWRRAVAQHPASVFEAATSLAVGGLHQPACASGAWKAILERDTATDASAKNRRFAALLGLQSLLLAEGKYDEVTTLIDADTVLGEGLHDELYILDAIAGADLGAKASAAVARLEQAYQAKPSVMSSVSLWFLGVWKAHQGQGEEAERIAETLATRARRSGDRRERLLAKAMAAQAALARGDSARALVLLQAVAPTGDRDVLRWYPWESLGGEQFALAHLRFARGDFREALRVAADFDAPAPVIYLIYLPASLALRLRAARALGETRLAERYRARLTALGRADLSHAAP